MKFFFDNNISDRIAPAIACLADGDRDQVVHLKEKFPPDTADTIWIPALANEKGWIILSGDCRIRTRPGEREAFGKAGLTTFFFAKGWMNTRFWDQAALLVRWWPKIREQAGLAVAGSFFEVPHKNSGRFRPTTLSDR